MPADAVRPPHDDRHLGGGRIETIITGTGQWPELNPGGDGRVSAERHLCFRAVVSA